MRRRPWQLRALSGEISRTRNAMRQRRQRQWQRQRRQRRRQWRIINKDERRILNEQSGQRMRSRRPWPATSRCRPTTERDAERGGELTVVDGVSGAAEPDEARSVIRHARRRRRRSSTAHCIFGGSAPRRAALHRLRIAALPTFSFFSFPRPTSSLL